MGWPSHDQNKERWDRGVGSLMVEQGSFQFPDGGSSPTPTLHVKDLRVERCEPSHAVAMVKQWHSRLPYCQDGPWMMAFRMHHDNITYAVALWHNTSARNLPQSWLELRRMACGPSSPKNTPSRFLAIMGKLIKAYFPQCSRMISYQDCEVHTGTIYKAAGWIASASTPSPPRARNREPNRKGTRRAYRTNSNGFAPNASAKIRWEKSL